MATVCELKSVLSPSMHRTFVKLQLNLHQHQRPCCGPHKVLHFYALCMLQASSKYGELKVIFARCFDGPLALCESLHPLVIRPSVFSFATDINQELSRIWIETRGARATQNASSRSHCVVAGQPKHEHGCSAEGV